MRIPLSTYRLQFRRGFGFTDARRLVPYLHQLGISDVYCSPIFKASSDTSSGYDVIDPNALNPALGQPDEFLELSAELKRLDMGLILDIVPNHMAAHTSNTWWTDVLENGPSSQYATYFDIEWDPPSHHPNGKVLWPILGAPYADVLERQEFRLTFSQTGFAVRYFDRSLPIDPATYGSVLSHVQLALAGAEDCAALSGEVASLAGLAQAIPPTHTRDAEEIGRRYREKEELKRQLWALYAGSPCFQARLDGSLRAFNGEPGDPRSFDLLDDLLGQQPYVLSFWQVAREKVNYRRFFDIAGLVGVNVQDPDVFAATHALVFQLVDEGWATGLRVDHIDGLYDPTEYLQRLRARLPDCYIVVEKILESKELLPREWPVAGTTGYDLINSLNAVMTDAAGLERTTGLYRRITGKGGSLADEVYAEKKRVMAHLFEGEGLSLSLHLNLLAEQDRYAKDASPKALAAALIEVTACLPVYRTYTRSLAVRPPDLLQIEHALLEARRRNPQVSEIIWSFIRRVLLLECPPALTAEQRARWKQFVQRWQQFSGPVMAKGKEDTAFYTYNRLISMNEVGGQDDPWPLEDFRQFAENRARCQPHTFNAGSTHDTKRGEDVRARIQVLAEMPEAWGRAVKRWRRWNARVKRVLDCSSVPSPNEEFFIYQTLLGSWPLDPSEMESYRERLRNALVKSFREAKVNTSWANPRQEYESAVTDFVSTLLTPHPENRFLPDFLAFEERIAAYGAFHSLSQTLLRLTLPGVPDIYQGSELWDLSLVDPDNRRPVDFAKRQTLLNSTDGDQARLLAGWRDGAVKQFLIQKVLCCRRENPAVFRGGDYIPLDTEGRHAGHVIAFARHSGLAWVVAVAPRFPAILSHAAQPPLGKRIWADTELSLPATAPGRWWNLLTGEDLEVPGGGRLQVGGILRTFPVALLAARPD